MLDDEPAWPDTRPGRIHTSHVNLGSIVPASPNRPAKRLAVFSDFSYAVEGDKLYAELPFSLFLQALSEHFQKVILIGRQGPSGSRFPYELHDVEFEPVPYYATTADLSAVMRALGPAMLRMWRAIERADVVWVQGPHPPQAIALALLAMIHGRRVVLGVRQDLPQYVRHRHPGRRHMWAMAVILEHAFRLLGRMVDVVVVGPELQRLYRHSKRVHVAYISLLSDSDICAPADDARSYEGLDLRLLSVGRLDPEKNPLLMLDVLHHALQSDPRWRLEVCGDGSLMTTMSQRASELGIDDRVVLHGHVTFGDKLWELYTDSHALLHVSMTEGAPQVLLEAFAARLPVVATAVGGVPDMVAGRGLLVGAQDARGAAVALQRLVDDPALRASCVESAVAFARDHTIEAESARLADFLSCTQA